VPSDLKNLLNIAPSVLRPRSQFRDLRVVAESGHSSLRAQQVGSVNNARLLFACEQGVGCGGFISRLLKIGATEARDDIGWECLRGGQGGLGPMQRGHSADHWRWLKLPPGMHTLSFSTTLQ